MQINAIPGVMPEKQNRTYWSIIDGRLATKTQEGAQGAIKRINKLNKEVWEYHVRGVEGVLHMLMYREGDYGRQLEITLRKDDHLHIISLSAEGRFHQQFVERLPNILLHRDISIEPYKLQDKSGKEISGITIKQVGVKIESRFVTKDSNGQWKCLHGYPEYPHNFKMLSKKDQTIFFLNRNEFLENVVTKWVQDVDIERHKTKEAEQYPEQDESLSMPEDDDLPF